MQPGHHTVGSPACDGSAFRSRSTSSLTGTRCTASEGPNDALERVGGHAVKSPAELVEAAAVVVTCVPSIEALEKVVGGAQGIAAAMRPGLVVVDVGTFSVARKERIRERLRSVGAEMLDAPVSGTPEMVAARKATAFVSGRPELYELVEPMLRRSAKRHRTSAISERDRRSSTSHN